MWNSLSFSFSDQKIKNTCFLLLLIIIIVTNIITWSVPSFNPPGTTALCDISLKYATKVGQVCRANYFQTCSGESNKRNHFLVFSSALARTTTDARKQRWPVNKVANWTETPEKKKSKLSWTVLAHHLCFIHLLFSNDIFHHVAEGFPKQQM